MVKCANVNATNYSEFTALYEAAHNGHVECVRILHKRGAKIEAMGHRSRGPLHAAAKYGHCSIVQFLLDEGANIDAAIDDNGCTPLAIAIEQQRSDVVMLLLKRGANCYS